MPRRKKFKPVFTCNNCFIVYELEELENLRCYDKAVCVSNDKPVALCKYCQNGEFIIELIEYYIEEKEEEEHF